MTGKNWRQLKATCKTKNCFHSPPPGKDYCGPCWKLMQQCASIPADYERKQLEKLERSAEEDAGTETELGA